MFIIRSLTVLCDVNSWSYYCPQLSPYPLLDIAIPEPGMFDTIMNHNTAGWKVQQLIEKKIRYPCLREDISLRGAGRVARSHKSFRLLFLSVTASVTSSLKYHSRCLLQCRKIKVYSKLKCFEVLIINMLPTDWQDSVWIYYSYCIFTFFYHGTREKVLGIAGILQHHRHS